MSLRTEYQPGEFCWIDLMAHDMEAAAKFYRALLGWSAETQDTQGGPPYTIFTRDGKNVAGMGQMGDEMKAQGTPPIWNSYVAASDLEATTGRATELGAMLMMPPMQVMDAGNMAILSDPTGAMLSLWQPGRHFGAELVNEVGCWCWNELATRDMAGAQEFYARLFGWEYERNECSPVEYYVAKLNERMACGLIAMDERWGETPPCWGVYFTVEDVDAACDAVRAAGGNVVAEPFDAPPAGKIAVATDNQGGTFNVIQLADPPD